MRENEYSYFLFSLKEDFAREHNYQNALYAYTDDKEMKKNFMNTRDMSIFDVKKKRLSKNQVSCLATDFRDLSLVKYEFKIIKDIKITIPITMEEKSTIEGIGNIITLRDIYESATDINPVIFSGKSIDVLQSIGYIDFFLFYTMGLKDDKREIKPNLLNIFFNNFGKLIEFKKG